MVVLHYVSSIGRRKGSGSRMIRMSLALAIAFGIYTTSAFTFLGCSSCDGQAPDASMVDAEQLTFEVELADEVMPAWLESQGASQKVQFWRASDGALIRVSTVRFDEPTGADEFLFQRLKEAERIVKRPDTIDPARTETDRATYRAIAIFPGKAEHLPAVLFTVRKYDQQAGGIRGSDATVIEGPTLRHVNAFEERALAEDI